MSKFFLRTRLLGTSGKPKIDKARNWLTKNGYTKENLQTLFSLIKKPEKKLIIAREFLAQEGRGLEDLEFILAFFNDDLKKSDLAKSWLAKEGRNLEDLKFILPLLGHRRLDIAKSWIEENEITQENLMEITNFFEGDLYKSLLVQCWLARKENIFREGGSLEDLKFAFTLPFYNNGKNMEVTENILKDWIDKNQINSLEDLKFVVPFFKSRGNRATIARDWIDRNEITREVFIDALHAFENDENTKLGIFYDWSGKKGRSLEDLKFAFALDPESKAFVAWRWVEQNQVTREAFIEVIGILKNDYEKLYAAKYWLDKEETTLEDLGFCFSLFSDNFSKCSLFEHWIDKKRVNSEDLKFVLSFFNDKTSRYTRYETVRYKIVRVWINKNEITREGLIDALHAFENDEFRLAIIHFWINKKEKGLEDFKFVLPLIGDEGNKFRAAREWLKKIPDISMRSNEFFNLLTSGAYCSIYDINDLEKIVELYKVAEIPIDKFTGLCAELYPNIEDFQSRLFEEFINKSNPQIWPIDYNETIKSFILSFYNSEFAFYGAKTLVQKINLNDSEKTELTSSLIDKHYKSLSSLFANKTLEEFLTEDGLEAVRGIFGNDLSQINLVKLFAYYQLQANPELQEEFDAAFKSMLKPELLAKMSEDFIPCEESTLIKEAEFTKMRNLLSRFEGDNLNISSVKILSDYLASKATFDNLQEADIATFQIGKNNLIDEEGAIKASEAFKELLLTDQSQKPGETKEDHETRLEEFKTNLGGFFEKIFRLEGEINPKELIVLNDFFKRDKLLLAKLLQNDGGFDSFSTIFRTLADGCFANIGTQVRKALITIMMPDVCDQALFSVFDDKINTPSLNETGVDHPSAGTNAATIFNNTDVNRHFFAPNGLVKAVEDFFKDGKATAFNFIKTKISAEAGKEIYLRFDQDLDEDESISDIEKRDETKRFTYIEKHCAQLATYLVIMQTIPELLENRHSQRSLHEYRNTLDNILAPRTTIFQTSSLSTLSGEAAKNNRRV